MNEKDERWSGAVDSAILSLLGEVGKADLPGLVHVIRREGIHIQDDQLRRALGRLAQAGKVEIVLEGESQTPIVKLCRPFIGWT